MKILYKKKKIEVSARKVSKFGKFSGLMFKTKNSENLLFEFKKETKMQIHSFFVFFNFLAIWLDKKNRVVDFKKVNPFTPKISPNKSFSRLIEIPFNNKNKKIIRFFVGKKI